MKTKFLLSIVIILTLSGAVSAHGQVIIRHSGANDPLTEGFSIQNPPGEVELGQVFDNQGRDAWSIRDDRIFDSTFYRYHLQPEDAAPLANAPGWIMSATMRFVEPGAARLFFTTGSKSFAFEIYLDGTGDIRLTERQVPLYTFENGGTGYHEFSLMYDALDEMLTFWIDGIVRVSNVAGSNTSLPPELRFGNVGPQSHTHWNEVSLAIVPEPATAALLSGLGALLVVGVFRRRQRKQCSEG